MHTENTETDSCPFCAQPAERVPVHYRCISNELGNRDALLEITKTEARTEQIRVAHREFMARQTRIELYKHLLSLTNSRLREQLARELERLETLDTWKMRNASDTERSLFPEDTD